MKTINKTTIYIAIGTLMLGILIGWLIFSSNTSTNSTKGDIKEQKEKTIWTCSMHPQIRQLEAGNCPICGMELIPLNTESSTNNPLEINMSPTAMQLANVQTSVIVKQNPVKEVRINGKVKADERKIFSQSSHIPGRIEKLLVSFTGESVKIGQVLSYIYSPDLITAQDELFEAYKIKANQPELYQAARAKLLNWKLTESQIDKIIEKGKPQEQFPVLADVSGVVLNKRVNLGDYVQKGQSLFEIADLSKVWVLFDVYESDITWIKKGDEVTFEIPSLPEERFKGEITFIDPFINPKTRVATARVELNNSRDNLKPDMFAVGIVKSPIENKEKELIVPKSAVMWTGERSVVYVKKSSKSGVNFILREVTLGPSLGSSYIIKEGIKEGEEIATNGTFSIDAAAQLAGKPSMMNPEGGTVMTGHNHGESLSKPNKTSSHAMSIYISETAKDAIIPLFDDYLLMKEALVQDKFQKSKEIASLLLVKLTGISMSMFTGEAHNIWMKHSTIMKQALKNVNNAENIGEVRKQFKTVSDQLVMIAITFGPFHKELYIQHCPMANDNKGADWISNNKLIKNPYFGESMIGCGEVTKSIE